MSVVFQIAGKYRPGADEKLADAYATFKRDIATCNGYERSMLLVNHTMRQMQLLLYFSSFEQGLACYSEVYPKASQPLAQLVEPRATLIASQLEVLIAKAA